LVRNRPPQVGGAGEAAIEMGGDVNRQNEKSAKLNRVPISGVGEEAPRTRASSGAPRLILRAPSAVSRG
jgi:hypothetical protein